MAMQTRGGPAGGALRLSLPCKSSVVIPGSPSARQRTSLVRLTRGLKLNTGHWLLRFSVLRETPMTSTFSIPFSDAAMPNPFQVKKPERPTQKSGARHLGLWFPRSPASLGMVSFPSTSSRSSHHLFSFFGRP